MIIEDALSMLKNEGQMINSMHYSVGHQETRLLH